MKMLVEKSNTAQVSRILRIAPPVPRRGVVKLRDGEFVGRRKRETTSTQEKTPNENKILKLSRSPSPRRLTRPTSGRSPDSRFSGLAAFPTVTPPLYIAATPTRSVAFWPALHDHSGGAAEEWERKTKRKGNLAEFFASSPLRGSKLRLRRVNGKLRRVDL